MGHAKKARIKARREAGISESGVRPEKVHASDEQKRNFSAGGEIRLQNPVSDHFPAFIVANAHAWQQDALARLRTMVPPDEYATVEAAFDDCPPGLAYPRSRVFSKAIEPFEREYVVNENSVKDQGKTVVICGAGPSLADAAAEWCPKGDAVWGCNSALIYLHERGHKVTHGFTIDQTADMVAEWYDAPPVDEYLLASTAHPHLTAHLRGKGRRIRWLHNFVGIKERPVAFGVCQDDACGSTTPPNVDTCPDCGGTNIRYGRMDFEDWLYATCFPGTVRAGSGLNATTRAIDVALVMGYDHIVVLGNDCALKVTKPLDPNARAGSPEYMAWLRDDVVMHADGGHALVSNSTAVTISGEIDGRMWLTKPDMIISAVWTVKMMRKYPQIQCIGDTLPNALKDKSNDYLLRLPTLVDKDNNPIYPE